MNFVGKYIALRDHEDSVFGVVEEQNTDEGYLVLLRCDKASSFPPSRFLISIEFLTHGPIITYIFDTEADLLVAREAWEAVVDFEPEDHKPFHTVSGRTSTILPTSFPRR
jgi:hypothetical protein